MSEQELRELFGEDVHTEPNTARYLESPVRLAGQAAHKFDSLANPSEHFRAFSPQDLSGSGEPNFARRSLKQARRDCILQTRNATAHSRLGQAQRSGGRRETAEVGDAFKDPKIVEIEHSSIVPSGGQCVQSQQPTKSVAGRCVRKTTKEITMTDLFDRFDLKGLPLSNRAVMSAMTRTRATEDDVPTDVMRDYYVQRASAGLIVTECTQISDQGHGIIRAPGLHRADQIVAWREITDAVHAAGGRIYCQIWHCGRVAHPDMRGGEQPVGPSPIPATGDFFLPSGRVEFSVPRELGIDETPGIIADFVLATRNARDAGFDGVELHGANGYLQDQFLQDGSNRRTDAYGGSIENRARLMLETAKAMIDAWSADRVGVRLYPSSYLYGVDDSN